MADFEIDSSWVDDVQRTVDRLVAEGKLQTVKTGDFTCAILISGLQSSCDASTKDNRDGTFTHTFTPKKSA